jgi:hypothetical protein
LGFRPLNATMLVLQIVVTLLLMMIIMAVERAAVHSQVIERIDQRLGLRGSVIAIQIPSLKKFH